MNSKIIDCLPPHRRERAEPSFRLPWWAWIAIALAIAYSLFFH